MDLYLQHAEAEAALPPTAHPEIDQALADLVRHKDEWARLPLCDRCGEHCKRHDVDIVI